MKRLLSLFGRGFLVVAALLMAASGAIRIGEGVGHAMAETAPPLDPAVGDGEPAPMPETCPPPPAELARALQEREATASARDISLARREAAVALAEGLIEQRLQDLARAEDELAALVTQADRAAEDDIARLTAVYEAMKPKQAAAILDQMVPEFAAGFLGRMQPDSAAQILQAMRPENGHAVTVLLAGRNARAPTQ